MIVNSNIVYQVAEDLQIPKDIVMKVYKLYWKTIKSILEEIPLKLGLSEEQFNKYRHSISIPSLGKFYISYDKYSKTIDSYNKKLENA